MIKQVVNQCRRPLFSFSQFCVAVSLLCDTLAKQIECVSSNNRSQLNIAAIFIIIMLFTVSLVTVCMQSLWLLVSQSAANIKLISGINKIAQEANCMKCRYWNRTWQSCSILVLTWATIYRHLLQICNMLLLHATLDCEKFSSAEAFILMIHLLPLRTERILKHYNPIRSGDECFTV